MQQVTPNNNSIQIPGSKEISSIRVVESCGCGYPKLYARYKGETQYVPLKICNAPSAPGLNNRYVDVFSDQTVNGVKSFANYMRVSSSYIKGGATQIFGNTAGGGLSNVLIGTGAGNAMTGQKNIMIGDYACAGAKAINNTVAIGVQSGPLNNYLGDNNFFLGYKAGYNMTGGSGNVHIGQGSGISGTYSNRLFIGNTGEPATSESAHIITGYFDTGVLKFPKGYANTDTSKFLTTGSDGTLVLSAPKMPTDYLSINPANTLTRDDTSNHGITDANLIGQSLTYWNNSTKTNTPAGFDQGVGITGISPDGAQAGQIVLDKTANILSFRSKATNVWKAWRTVETTDNKVTSLSSPSATTYPSTSAVTNYVTNSILAKWQSSNVNAGTNHYCKFMTIVFPPNVYKSFVGIYDVFGYHGSDAGEDFAGQIYIFTGGGTSNNNICRAYFKQNPFSKNSLDFYFTYDATSYTFTFYVYINQAYQTVQIQETVKPTLSASGVTYAYNNQAGMIASLPTGAVEFTKYTLATTSQIIIPSLQQVTTAGNTSTNDIIRSGGTAGTQVILMKNGVQITTPTSSSAYARSLFLYDNNNNVLGAAGWYGDNNTSVKYGYLSTLSGSNYYAQPDIKFTGGMVGINLPTGTANLPLYNLDVRGNAAISSLAGTGARMVTADGNGMLGVQAMPVLVETDPVYTADKVHLYRTDATNTSYNATYNVDLNTSFFNGVVRLAGNTPNNPITDTSTLLNFKNTSAEGGQLILGNQNEVLYRGSYYNVSTNSQAWAPWKRFVFRGDNISLFNNDAGYITSTALSNVVRTDLTTTGYLFNGGTSATDLTAITNNSVIRVNVASTNAPPMADNSGGTLQTYTYSNTGYRTQIYHGFLGRFLINSSNNGIWSGWKELLGDGDKISRFNNDVGYIITETDPIFTADKPNLVRKYKTSDIFSTLPGAAADYQGSVLESNTNSTNLPSGENNFTGINLMANHNTSYRTIIGAGTSGNLYTTRNNGGSFQTYRRILTQGDNNALLANGAGYITNAAIGNGTLTLATSGIATGSATFSANQSANNTFTVTVPATDITASLNSTTNLLSINSSTGAGATVDLSSLMDGQVLVSGGGWQLKGQGTGKQTVGAGAMDFIIYDSAYTGTIGAAGDASVAFGKGNLSSGSRSATFGSENVASGSRSFAIGLSTGAIGDGSFTQGQGTKVTGAWGAGFGISVVAGNYAFAAGNGNYAPSYSEVSVGIWGTNYTPASATAVNANDRIFNIGNGTSSAARKDALTVYKSGVVNISNLSGTGNRMVIADASGALSTQAITSGTVTSVGMTVGGAALNVTPAAITSSGTFALTWAGTTSQYINGQGNLVTFPTIPAGTVTSITIGNGLTGSSPITATGTITLGTPSSITLSSTNGVTAGSHTHAFLPGGTTSQYIRGDGSLAAMPSIPTVGNGTLTIQQNGSTVGTFTANQSSNTTINLTGGSNEVVDNGYGYGRSNNFGSGWDAVGGFAANSIYITTNTPYPVSENDYTVYLFASGASVILPNPASYRNRMIRLVNATKAEINAPQQYAIMNYDGNPLTTMGIGSYLIQSIRGAGGAWLWYLVGGNS